VGTVLLGVPVLFGVIVMTPMVLGSVSVLVMLFAVLLELVLLLVLVLVFVLVVLLLESFGGGEEDEHKGLDAVALPDPPSSSLEKKKA